MGTSWHVPETGGPPGLEPGIYCRDMATRRALLADPSVESASVPWGEPCPMVHGMKVHLATPQQIELLQAFSRPAPVPNRAARRRAAAAAGRA